MLMLTRSGLGAVNDEMRWLKGLHRLLQCWTIDLDLRWVAGLGHVNLKANNNTY